MEDHFVYILQSLVHGRYYTGISSSPEQRLNAHNEGVNKSTRHGVPWNSIWISQQLTKHNTSRSPSEIVDLRACLGLATPENQIRPKQALK